MQVTEKQYRKVIKDFAGIIAHRIDEHGNFWIKLWYMNYRDSLKRALNEPTNN